jgi:hypothetical protein
MTDEMGLAPIVADRLRPVDDGDVGVLVAVV